MEDTVVFDEKLLKSIKVAIKRGDFQQNQSTKDSPLKRDLLDPESLKIHINGTNRVPVFSRADVKANAVKLETESLDSVDRPKSSALFKEYYNHAPPSHPGCSKDNAYPSTSREYQSTSSRRYRDRSKSSEISDSSRSRRESRRSNERKSRKYDGDGRSKSPKYYRRSSSRSRERRKSRSRSPSEKYYKEYATSRRKSQSPNRRRSPDYKYKKKYPRSPERRRSQTPLRPGEYRPPKHHERSPPTHRRKSPPLRPGEYRPKRYHSRSPERSRSPAVRHPRPAPHGFYEPFIPPPPHMMPRYMPDMFRSNGPILIPHIQYIPVPQPMMPPIRHHTPIRPPRIYNNRTIPILNTQVKNVAPTKTDEKKEDSKEEE
ncbi:PREDICTED: serine/arginine repetitive matrix protein 1-like [Nicrophorus vespilloides]|uniref:Serine/arginine repetitive matrix protein 1-like n=1 Tax=Nicrophorus vespilloides TaxID=110193 RepID=A0ABM1N5I2_NICVS|nr:PREDICTED: serine/arginine repetitive matrix protein 1-like [Nicrophorus vespilloides]